MTRSRESTWCEFDGYIMRSIAESRVAGALNGLGINYLYEHMPYDFSGYLPDFYLPALDMFIEVKGAKPTPGEIEKCEQLHRKTGCAVLLVDGRPNVFQHHDHDDGYVRPEVAWVPRILIAGQWGALVVNRICRAIYRAAGKSAGEHFVMAVSSSGADRLQPIGPYAVQFLHEISSKAGRRCRAIYEHNEPINAARLAAMPSELSTAEQYCLEFIGRRTEAAA